MPKVGTWFYDAQLLDHRIAIDNARTLQVKTEKLVDPPLPIGQLGQAVPPVLFERHEQPLGAICQRLRRQDARHHLGHHMPEVMVDHFSIDVSPVEPLAEHGVWVEHVHRLLVARVPEPILPGRSEHRSAVKAEQRRRTIGCLNASRRAGRKTMLCNGSAMPDHSTPRAVAQSPPLLCRRPLHRRDVQSNNSPVAEDFGTARAPDSSLPSILSSGPGPLTGRPSRLSSTSPSRRPATAAGPPSPPNGPPPPNG